MRSRRNFFFLLLCVILIQNKASNNTESKRKIPLDNREEDKQFNIYCKVVKLQQKRIFLERCEKQKVLLRSNQKSGIDYDLLLIQQSRRIAQSIKEIDRFVTKNRNLKNTLTKTQKNQMKAVESRHKTDYISKFNWTLDKQFDKIISLHLTSSKKRKNKSDHKRYCKRKALKAAENCCKKAEDTILNKSDYSLNEHHKKVLMYGLDFVPTTNWTKEVELNERLNLAMHVRKVEWEDILPREENFFENEMPPKLKIPKFNRPHKDLLSQQVDA